MERPIFQSPKFFPKFTELSEDLMVYVISYVATVPLEHPHASPRSTLTGVLPLVCKQFNHFCKSDYLWQTSLKRLKRTDPSLWEEGLVRLLPHGLIAEENLVDQLHDVLQIDYKSIHRRVVDTYIRVTGPVFYMTGALRLGRDIGLHFFEPRYRLLIAEVMRDWPVSARQGGPIGALTHGGDGRGGRLPTFIYAHMAPLAPTTPACLVQVRQCIIHPDGSADVLLTPVSYVWLERVWERPNSGRLCSATCLRMGREQARQMEYQVHRGGGGAGGGRGSNAIDVMQADNLSRGNLNALLSYILAGREHVAVGNDTVTDTESDDDA
jgi:hypothetical protein